MRYVAGIDGGQSRTHAALADEHGTILGRGAAGPADELGVGAGSTRLRDALAAALDKARGDAALEPEIVFSVVVAGLSGYDGRVRGVAPSLPAERLVLVHDSITAHAAAFGGGPGVVVIAGTGSFAYGVAADGRTKIAGGWGYLFGDEGSAFWVAKTALSGAMRGETGSGAILPEALQFFGAPDLRVLAKRVYNGEIARDRVAAFAQAVLRLQPERYREVGEALGALAIAALPDSGERPRVAFVGGMVRDPKVREAIAVALNGRCDIVDPQRTPAEGAVLLALQELGSGPSTRLALRASRARDGNRENR
jgi:glucosamine kinase